MVLISHQVEHGVFAVLPAQRVLRQFVGHQQLARKCWFSPQRFDAGPRGARRRCITPSARQSVTLLVTFYREVLMHRKDARSKTNQ